MKVCRKCNLVGVDLTGVSLKKADLINPNLSGAKLMKVDLQGAKLRCETREGLPTNHKLDRGEPGLRKFTEGIFKRSRAATSKPEWSRFG